jgi:hypothetical protein
VHSTPELIRAFISVDKLGDLPANFQGDRFEFEFSAGTKKFTFAGGRLGTAAAPVTADPNRGQLNGTTTADLKPKATFDKAHNVVILDIDRAKLDKVNGSPVANGTVLTGVVARTYGLQPALQFPADTAQAATAAAQVFTVGVSPCFSPPPAVITNIGALTAQYGDAARVAAKLASADGKPLAGKRVTFGLAGKAVVTRTDASGRATAAIPLAVTASRQTLSVAFAGDDTADKAVFTTAYTITAEKTRLILSVVRKGTARTVTLTLLDDDNHPVAGQRIVLALNGKAVATLRTASNGKAVYSKAKPGQTVKVTFASVAGRYIGSTAQLKV